MNLFEQLKIGETVELRLGAVTSRTRVERIDSETTFVISQPTHKLLPIVFQPNETAVFFFFRDSGIYSFQANYTTRGTIDNFRVCGFIAISEIEKSQRRFSYRLPVELPMTIRRINQLDQNKAAQYEAKTVNISQEGILFSCEVPLQPNTHFLLELNLSDVELCILHAEVIRCEPPRQQEEPFHIAARFINMIKRDQAQIAKFILNKQIIERKQRQEIEML